MVNSSSGLIRPHCSRLATLHRFVDGALILLGLELSCRLYDIQFSLIYILAATVAMINFMFFAELKGLYQSWRISSTRSKITRMLGVWFVVLMVLIVLAFLTKTTSLYSRRAILSWVLLTMVLQVSLRISIRLMLSALRTHGHNTRTVAFAGAGDVTQKLFAKVESAPWMGLKVAGVYDDRDLDRLFLGKLPLEGTLSKLVEDARDGKLDYVYITLPMHAEKRIMQLLDELADTTASVYVVPDFFVFELLHSRWMNMGGIPMVSVFESPFYGVDGWFKRLEDVILGSLILLLIAPLMLVIALGVKFTSPGAVLFKQRRYGLNGEIVEVWKFRSMSVCEDGGHVPQAKKGDARITPFGAFLRRTSLDELPQFINVIQGTMSIVGPRPHAVAHNEQYRSLIHGYMLRHKVKPGITGLAQVNGWRGETDTLEKMQKRVEFDLNYIRNWSLWLDLRIIWKTMVGGFAGKNAY